MEILRKGYPKIPVMYNAAREINNLKESKYKKKGDDPVTPITLVILTL